MTSQITNNCPKDIDTIKLCHCTRTVLVYCFPGSYTGG